jgi:acyl-CoA reductase-like NAD-dependent aldehyde dehydrogenase
VLWKIGDLVEEHLEEFAELESLDNGKPVSVARVADVPLSLLNPRVAASLRQLQYPAGRERDCAMLLSSLLCSSLSNTFVVGMTT